MSNTNHSFSASTISKLLLGTALFAIYPTTGHAQVTISDAQTTSVNTSTADDGAASDVVIDSTGSVTLSSGTAVTLDSDNSLTLDGDINIADADDVIGVDIVGGNTGEFTFSATGDITIDEEYARSDTDEDGLPDGVFAEGNGRTGILISGTSPFTGDITTVSGSSISVEGNDSYGVSIAQDAGLIGNLTLDSQIFIIGDNSAAVNILGDITGDVEIDGTLATQGEGSQALNIAEDVTGALNITGDLSSTGYTSSTRLASFFREQLDSDDTLQGGPTVSVSGNVDNGIYIANSLSTVTDDDGNETVFVSDTPSITQAGSAPAFLLSGNGTPILVGLVADITDSTDDDYDETLQYGLINEGSITAGGILNDVGATAIRLEDVTVTGGFSNEGSVISTTFRAPITGTDDDVSGDVAHAYGLSIGSGTTLSRIDNSGTISVAAAEDSDLAFTDEGDLEANNVNATALLIEAGANVAELTNTGTLSSVLSGRQGQAYALVDSSGTLASITNEGFIFATGGSSDPELDDDSVTPVFTLVAIDVSENASGVTITQQVNDTVTSPLIAGDALLGSGDDTLISTAGTITSDVTFGSGDDTFSLSDTIFRGTVSDTNGTLALSLSDGSQYIPTAASPVSVASLDIDETSNLYSFIDGGTGTASTITASGEISIADGAQVTPLLNNIIDIDNTLNITLLEAGTLSLGGTLESLQPTETPYLYDISYISNGDDLVASLTQRDTSALGLDATQLGANNSVFEASFANMVNNVTLGEAFAAITSETDFITAYNQILPEFNDSVAQFIGSNVDGATGGVATHLNNTRLSDEKPGGLWIEEFGYFADRELIGLSEAYRGYGFGFTGGIDTAWGPFHAIGFNLGFGATEVEDVLGIDDPLAVQTLQSGLYAGSKFGNFSVDGYLGGGVSLLESNRFVEIGDYSGSARSEWTGVHYNGAINAGYDIFLGEKMFIRPTLGVSYLTLEEQSHIEDGDDAIRFVIDDRFSRTGTASALMNIGGYFQNDKRWIRPSVRFGVKSDFISQGTTTFATYANSSQTFAILSQRLPSEAALFGASFAMGTNYSSFGIDYDADIRDGYNMHTLRVVLRMLF